MSTAFDRVRRSGPGLEPGLLCAAPRRAASASRFAPSRSATARRSDQWSRAERAARRPAARAARARARRSSTPIRVAAASKPPGLDHRLWHVIEPRLLRPSTGEARRDCKQARGAGMTLLKGLRPTDGHDVRTLCAGGDAGRARTGILARPHRVVPAALQHRADAADRHHPRRAGRPATGAGPLGADPVLGEGSGRVAALLQCPRRDAAAEKPAFRGPMRASPLPRCQRPASTSGSEDGRQAAVSRPSDGALHHRLCRPLGRIRRRQGQHPRQRRDPDNFREYRSRADP